METKTINYVPAEMESFKYILEAAITANLNIKTDMAVRAIAVEIPKGNDFNERMETGARIASVNFTSTVVTPAEDERDNIIAQIAEKNAELEQQVNFYRDEETKYRKFWIEETTKHDRIKEQVGALKVMMDAIFDPIL